MPNKTTKELVQETLKANGYYEFKSGSNNPSDLTLEELAMIQFDMASWEQTHKETKEAWDLQQKKIKKFFEVLTLAKQGATLTSEEETMVTEEKVFSLDAQMDTAKGAMIPGAFVITSSPALPEETPFDMVLKTRNLSYSSLDQWDKCQSTWFAKYVLELKDMGSAAMLYGSTVHEALEYGNKLYQITGEVPDPNDPAAWFATRWVDVTEALPKPTGKLTAFFDEFWGGVTFEMYLAAGTELVQRYFKKYAQLYPPLEIEVRKEISLTKMYPNLGLKHLDRFVGRIDLISEGGDKGIVCDYKTKTSPGNHNFLKLDLQPTAYAVLLGRPIEFHYIELIRGSQGLSIRNFDTGRLQDDVDWFTFKYLPTKAKEIDQKLRAFYQHFPVADLEAIKQDESELQRLIDASTQLFPPSPGWQCDYCVFRFRCGYRLPLDYN